jgi:hypothetical protein
MLSHQDISWLAAYICVPRTSLEDCGEWNRSFGLTSGIKSIILPTPLSSPMLHPAKPYPRWRRVPPGRRRSLPGQIRPAGDLIHSPPRPDQAAAPTDRTKRRRSRGGVSGLAQRLPGGGHQAAACRSAARSRTPTRPATGGPSLHARARA